MLAVVIAEGVAIALLAVLVLGLLRSHALILRALHELGAGLELEKDAAAGGGAAGGAAGPVAVQIEPGVVPATREASSRAHDVVGEDLHGRPAHVELAGAGPGATLLAFLTSGCSVCLTFWEEFGPDTQTPGDARLLVVAKGSAEESPAILAKLARPGVEVVASSGAWVDYDIPGSPYFVLVEDGVVTGEGSATSWPSVRDLLQQAVHESAHARAAAGRTGPGGDPAAVLPTAGAAGAVGGTGSAAAGGRDDLSRIDAELAAAGIHPGHHSLFEPADPADDDEANRP
ncbi:MAG TPA: hypothetical protein VFL10_18010 [Ornithinibacter sp.]|nr:hypothetical protein [Ornithinibacter sp.]